MAGRLKREVINNWPAGGWKYLQPQTGWQLPNPLQHRFAEAVQLIIKHRKANPGLFAEEELKPEKVGMDLEEYTIFRLNGDPKFVENGDDGKKKASLPLPLNLLSRAVGHAVDVPNPRVLESWLGKGGVPVSAAQSQERSEICVTCQEGNDTSTDWTKWAIGLTAAMIKRALEVKNQLHYQTTNDPKLGTCRFCQCWNPLKVHVPLAEILQNEDPLTLQKMPEHCWIKREQTK